MGNSKDESKIVELEGRLAELEKKLDDKTLDNRIKTIVDDKIQDLPPGGPIALFEDLMMLLIGKVTGKELKAKTIIPKPSKP